MYPANKDELWPIGTKGKYISTDYANKGKFFFSGDYKGGMKAMLKKKNGLRISTQMADPPCYPQPFCRLWEGYVEVTFSMEGPLKVLLAGSVLEGLRGDGFCRLLRDEREEKENRSLGSPRMSGICAPARSRANHAGSPAPNARYFSFI